MVRGVARPGQVEKKSQNPPQKFSFCTKKNLNPPSTLFCYAPVVQDTLQKPNLKTIIQTKKFNPNRFYSTKFDQELNICYTTKQFTLTQASHILVLMRKNLRQNHIPRHFMKKSRQNKEVGILIKFLFGKSSFFRGKILVRIKNHLRGLTNH